jgi:FkbM family methyltransferase
MPGNAAMKSFADRVKFAILSRPFFRYHCRFDIADGSAADGSGSLKVPVIEGTGFDNLTQNEPVVEQMIAYLLDLRPGWFVDVGASIGQTLLKVARHDRTRPYVGFEVQPLCLNYLDQLILVNRLDRFKILPIGLSNADRFATLTSEEPGDPRATTVQGFWPSGWQPISRTVPLRVGDDVMDEFGLDRIAILKVDVEGAEADVLEGLERTIARHRPYILIEILPYSVGRIDQNGDVAAEIRSSRMAATERLLHLNEARGYRSFRMMPNAGLLETTDYDVPYHPDNCNYLFVPEERVGEVGASTG